MSNDSTCSGTPDPESHSSSENEDIQSSNIGQNSRAHSTSEGKSEVDQRVPSSVTTELDAEALSSDATAFCQDSKYSSWEEAVESAKQFATRWGFLFNFDKTNLVAKCSRNGKPRSKKPLTEEQKQQGFKPRDRKSLKCGCKFFLQGRIDGAEYKWETKPHGSKHTSPCSPSPAQMRLVQRSRGRTLPPALAEAMYGLAQMGSTRQMRQFLATSNVEWGSTSKQLFNLRTRLRQSSRQTQTAMDIEALSQELPLTSIYQQARAISIASRKSGFTLNTLLMMLEAIKKESPGFQYRTRHPDGSSEVNGAIWMTARQRQVLGDRGVMLLSDGTPQTNVEGWHCVPFLVVNQHHKARTVAYYVGEGAENKDSIMWALRQLDVMCPRWKIVREVVFADYGLKETPYTEAFPDKPLKFFLCAWHWIAKDAPKQLTQDTKTKCNFLWKLVDAPSKDEFEALVATVRQSGSWSAKEIKYLTKWTERKNLWALPWREAAPTLGFKTTGMAEAMVFSLKCWLMDLDLEDSAHSHIDLYSLVLSSFYKELSTEKEEQNAADQELMYTQNEHGLRTHQKWKSQITKDFRKNFSEYCTTQFQEQLELSANYTLEKSTHDRWSVYHSVSKKSRALVFAQGKWTCDCNYAVCHMLPCRHILCKLAGGRQPQNSSLKLEDVAPYVNVHWQVETELLKDETIGEAGSGGKHSSSAPPCTDEDVRVVHENTDEDSSVADRNSPVQPSHVTDQPTAAAAKTRRETQTSRFNEMSSLAKQICQITSPHPEIWSRSMAVLRLLLARLNGKEQNGSQVCSIDHLLSLVTTQVPQVPVQAQTNHRTETTTGPSLHQDIENAGKSAPKTPALSLSKATKASKLAAPSSHAQQQTKRTK